LLKNKSNTRWFNTDFAFAFFYLLLGKQESIFK
jgi:hypothetical protein